MPLREAAESAMADRSAAVCLQVSPKPQEHDIMAIPQRGGLGRFSLKTLFVIMIGMVMTAYLAFGLWTWKVMTQVEVNGPEYHRVVLGKI